jgi:sulfatase maturation enzyme AslB (radical SAM superfamily)
MQNSNLTAGHQMKSKDVKWLYVEASSKCNAWCPACARNQSGYGLIPGLIEQDLSTDRFKDVLEHLPHLSMIQFGGNYGDPAIAHNFLDLLDVAKKQTDKIQIHTNGSLRNTKWWSELAVFLSDIDHDVWFGLDGLAGVHEIYRQGTNYQKIIDNASAFIQTGGFATWQFVPYAHNEHQVKDCIRTSQNLGFKKFKLVKLYRNKQVAFHYQTGKEFPLLPPKEFQHLLRMPKTNTTVESNNCMHQSLSSIYLAANGSLSSCCYFSEIDKFDTVEDLLRIKKDYTHQTCLESCGS